MLKATPPPLSPEQRLLPWFFMALESIWLAVLFDLLNRAAGFPLRGIPGLACLLYPLAYLARRPIRRFGLPWYKTAGAHLAVFVLGAGLALKLVLFPDLGWNLWAWSRESLADSPWKGWALVLGCGGFSWLRGFYLGLRRVDFRGLAGAFQMGLVVFLVVLPMWGVLGSEPGSVRLLVSGFFVLGLSGMWLAGRAGTDSDGRSRTTWMILVGLSLVLVLVLSAGFWSLVDRELVELMLRPLVWLWRRFVDLLDFLGRLLPEMEPTTLPDPGQAPPRPPGDGFREMLKDFKWLRKIGEIVFVTASLAIVGMALFRSLTGLLTWLRRRMGLDTDQTVEKSGYGFLDDLKALFWGLFQWLNRLLHLFRKKPGAADPLSPEAKTVRGIYVRFLSWGRARGLARESWATPYEYRDRMGPLLPGREEELVLLTETYVQVRYGRLEPDPELIRSVRSAWRRIKSSTPVPSSEEPQP